MSVFDRASCDISIYGRTLFDIYNAHSFTSSHKSICGLAGRPFLFLFPQLQLLCFSWFMKSHEHLSNDWPCSIILKCPFGVKLMFDDNLRDLGRTWFRDNIDFGIYTKNHLNWWMTARGGEGWVCMCVNDKAARPIFHDKKAKPKTFMLHIWP